MLFVVFKRSASDPFEAFCGDGLSNDEISRNAAWRDWCGVSADTADQAIASAIKDGFTGLASTPDHLRLNMPSSILDNVPNGRRYSAGDTSNFYQKIVWPDQSA
jgi:hypothetical protein